MPCQPWSEGRAFAVAIKKADLNGSWPAVAMAELALGIAGAPVVEVETWPRRSLPMARARWVKFSGEAASG